VRSASKGAATSLEIHLPKLEATRFFQQHLHLRFGALELCRCRAQELDSFFEKLERGVQPDLLILERGQNFLEPAKTCFEVHADAVSKGAAI
jgi:hypothetical protein